MKIYCGSEYNSASTTTLVKSTRSTPPFFGYRKWPSEPSNLQIFPLRGLYEGCALSGASKTCIDLGAARQKRRFFTKNRWKVTFSRCYAGFHPTFWAAGPLTLKNHQGVWSRPAVREYGHMDKDGDGSVDKEEFKIPCAAALDRDCADRCLTRG